MLRAPEPQRPAGGFTLVEAIATILVLGLALMAVVQTLSFAFARQSDGLWQARTVALAEAYLEEMDARRFDEASAPGGVPACSSATTPCSVTLGPDAGESRPLFDDVDDYDGLDESPPVDAAGAVLPGYEGFRVEVSVAYLSATQATDYGLDTTTDAKRIEVRVTPPASSTLSFVALRGNF